MKPTLEQFKESFWKRVDKNGPIPEHNPELGPCWIWTGKRNPKNYGKCQFQNKEFFAHRVSYAWAYGEIPNGKVTDHLCRNHSCVNPSHLEVVTQGVNVLRGETLFAKRKKQTHCIHGHLLGGDNLIIYRNGTRHCRECSRIWDKVRRPRKIWIGIEDKAEPGA